MNASRQLLPGARWHFQHGPIDIVIGAEGEPRALQAAHAHAWARFQGVLAELVAELPLLRQAVDPRAARNDECPLQGPVARRMWAACAPFAADGFITPMAAVAGSVAQELAGFYEQSGVVRAWLNNGGDIALHLAAGQRLRVGQFADLARFDGPALTAAMRGALPLDGCFEIDAAMPVRGLATSGWRGRSFSLGIADAVTVLATTAAQADAAATVIANAVNVEHPAVRRAPACERRDDSDLGALLVTVEVGPLPAPLVHQALQQGRQRAEALRSAGLIHSALLRCQGQAAASAPGETPALELVQ